MNLVVRIFMPLSCLSFYAVWGEEFLLNIDYWEHQSLLGALPALVQLIKSFRTIRCAGEQVRPAGFILDMSSESKQGVTVLGHTNNVQGSEHVHVKAGVEEFHQQRIW